MSRPLSGTGGPRPGPKNRRGKGTAGAPRALRTLHSSDPKNRREKGEDQSPILEFQPQKPPGKRERIIPESWNSGPKNRRGKGTADPRRALWTLQGSDPKNRQKGEDHSPILEIQTGFGGAGNEFFRVFWKRGSQKLYFGIFWEKRDAIISGEKGMPQTVCLLKGFLENQGFMNLFLGFPGKRKFSVGSLEKGDPTLYFL